MISDSLKNKEQKRDGNNYLKLRKVSTRKTNQAFVRPPSIEDFLNDHS